MKKLSISIFLLLIYSYFLFGQSTTIPINADTRYNACVDKNDTELCEDLPPAFEHSVGISWN